MVMPTNDEECDVVMSRCFSIGRSVVEFEVVEVETMVGRRVRVRVLAWCQVVLNSI